MTNPLVPTWVEVDLAAVTENARWYAENMRVPLMAVIKADAYGHGAVEIARTVLAAGASWLSVARMVEAHALRAAGVNAPVLVFGMTTPDEVDEAIASDVTLTLYSAETCAMMAARAQTSGKPLSVHLKVDTGLGRLGVLPWDALTLAQTAQSSGVLNLDGVYTHFAMVDEEPEHPINPLQIERFDEVLSALHTAGIQPRYTHMANTVGTMEYPNARYNLIRIGCGLVGINPASNQPFPAYLRRSLTWKTRLASCKLYPKGWSVGYGQEYVCAQDEWIGLLPVGYADGFARVPGNHVLIAGARVPIIGRICMDMCMIRLDQPLPAGEEVVLIGAQGEHSIQPEDLASLWNDTEVGVTSGIHFRVPRFYVR